MASIKFPTSASTTAAGIARVGAGIALPTAGTITDRALRGELYIDTNGSDATGDGAQGNPFRTLAAAYAFIASNPLRDGYSVNIPNGDWSETVGLPPPDTRLIGNGTLANAMGGANAWTEDPVEDAGLISIIGLTVVADITGRNGGSIDLFLMESKIVGTLTLMGRVVSIGGTGSFVLANCSNVSIIDSRADPATCTISLTYDPTAGSNGSGSVQNLASGGQWLSIEYDSIDAQVPFIIMGARVTSIVARQDAHVICSGCVVNSCESHDANSRIDYDGACRSDGTLPTYAGAGSFESAELILKRLVPQDYGPGTLTFAIPRQAGTTSLRNLFFSTDAIGIDVSYVSATANSITVHVQAPTSHPAYNLRVFVKP